MGGAPTAAGAMKFCSECNNILYPKEDAANRRLLLKCHNCDHQELAEDYMVFRNEVHHSTAEGTLVLTDVVTDPTLPRTNTVECPKCNHGEAVFFQSTSRNDAEAMTLFFVCSSAGSAGATEANRAPRLQAAG